MDTTPSLFSTAIAIIVAVITMYLGTHALLISNIYCYFTAPLGSRRTDENYNKAYVPYWQGFLALFAVFFSVSVVMAFTGGTLGMGVSQWTPETRSHMMWGFTCGLIATSVARMSSIYLTTTFAAYLQLLTIFVLSMCAYEFVLDFRFFTPLVDRILRPTGSRDFILFAVLSVSAALFIIEGLIYLVRNNSSANRIPYALLTERIQQHSVVHQVFFPSEAVAFPEAKLKKIILKDGLTDLIWLVHTPVSHLSTVLQSLRDCGLYTEEQVQKIMNEKIRILLTIPPQEPELILRYVKNPKNIRILRHPARVRYLIINGKHAIVQMPIPFRGDVGEQSNSTHWFESPPLVSLWLHKFESVWAMGQEYDNSKAK